MACLRRLSLRVVFGVPVTVLLVSFALALAACQPIQAPAQASEDGAAQAAVEATDVPTGEAAASTSVTATAPLTVTGAVTETADATASEAVTETGALTEAVPSSVDGSDANGSHGADAEAVAAGLAVYRAQYCGVCHQLDAAGTRGTFGPPHNGMGAITIERLADPNYHGSATTPRDYLIESIVDPLAYIVPGYAQTSHRMPIYSYLSVEEVEALAAFLLAQ